MHHLKRSLVLFLTVLLLCMSVTVVHASSDVTEIAETTQTTDVTDVTESTDTTQPEEPVTVSAEITVAPESDLPDSDELFDEYVYRLFYESEATPYKRMARDQLTNAGKCMYDFLKEMIVAVSAGQTSTEVVLSKSQISSWGYSTSYTVSNSSQAANSALNQFYSDFDLDNVISALLHDCPYEMYWYDKTTGVNIGGNFSVSGNTASVSSITFRFTVVYDMRSSGNAYRYNSANVSTATAAANNAKSIIATWKNASDLQKLHAYKDEICALVTYDTSAAQSGSFAYDADPWQMVSVFDKNPSTNVVCEGYSKAFQYLFDNSSFSSNYDCITVSGYADGGRHMWNVVRINGQGYLADVTNSDAGSFGQDGCLFLANATGSITGGYTIQGVKFSYNEETLSLWGTGSDSYLKLTSTPLSNACANGHDMGSWTVTKNATCTATGTKTRTCKRSGCGYSVTETIPATGHTYSASVTAPTCGQSGYTTHTCSCGSSYKDSYVNPTGNHNYNSYGVCRGCGHSRNELQSMYRVYNPYTHEHLLSGDVAEKNLLINIGWKLDGIAWKAPTTGTAVYRLYNPYDDWHTYSMSQSEISDLTSLGWKVDGVVTRSATKEEGTPIYRLFNPYEQKNYHLFTASLVEVQTLISLGWRLEGVAWYGIL